MYRTGSIGAERGRVGNPKTRKEKGPGVGIAHPAPVACSCCTRECTTTYKHHSHPISLPAPCVQGCNLFVHCCVMT